MFSIKEFPENTEAYHSLVALLIVTDSKNSKPALDIIKKLQNVQSSLNLETVKLESLTHCSYGNYEKARNSICKTIHMHPYEPKLWDLLAQVTLDNQFISATADQKKKTKRSKPKFEVDETPTPSTNSGAISQLTTQLLESSVSRFATETFSNDKESVVNRLLNISALYYSMGTAPGYHNAQITLKHALSMAQKALMLDPSNSKALRLLSSCTHSLSIFKKESAYYKASNTLLKGYLDINDQPNIEKSSFDLDMYVALLEQNIYAGEFTKCMGSVKQLMERFKDVAPIEATLFAVLAKCILVKGETWDKALKLFSNALKKDNSNLYTWFTLADLFTNQKKYSMAKYCLECCLKLSTKTNNLNNQFLASCKLCYTSLMMCLSAKGDVTALAKAGIEHAKNAFTINNESAALYFMYGKLCFILGNLDEAQNAYQQSLRIDPDHPLSSINLYWVYYNKEDWGPAEETLWAEKAKLSHQPEVFFTLSSFAFESGMPEPALKMIQKAIKLDPSNTKYWDYLSQIDQALKPKEPVKPPQGGSSKKKK